MRWGTAALICLMASPAVAEEFACAFDLECIDGEECNATEFALTIEVDETFEVMLSDSGVEQTIYDARIITDAETVMGGFLVGPDNTQTQRTFGSDAEASVGHVISILPDDSAEYLVIFEADDFSIEYKGQCIEVAS